MAFVASVVLICCTFQLAAEEEPQDLPLVFEEKFEAGNDRWEVMDPKTWRLSTKDGNSTFEITDRNSEYKPKVRSPRHIALIKEIELTDFVLTFRVRSTKDTGNHRDCCIFFAWQDPTHFYYAHLGARPDPASGQIMIVNDAPRAPLTKNERRTPWTDQWHQVKVGRDSSSGRIAVYFDDMDHPHMEISDTTFTRGRIGIGSFDDMDEFDDLELRGR
jgi:hypothetical protein